MPTPSQKEIFERLQRLPPKIREAMFAESTTEKVFEIAKKYDLLVDKTGEMASEIGLLMLGVTHPNDFTNNLAERMKISKDEARKIADDINASIFAPVREHLRALYGLPNSSAIPEPAPQTSPPASSHEQEARRASTPQTNIFADKLTQAHREERTEVHVGEKDASFEELKAELKKVLEEHTPRTSAPAPLPPPPPPPPPRPAYRGRDPYRELPTDEAETPAVQPSPTHPFPKSAIPPSAKQSIFETQKPASVPVPAYGMKKTLDESWTKADLASKPEKAPAPPADVPAHDGKLPGFRGFKMQPPPPASNPAQDTQSDSYREPTK